MGMAQFAIMSLVASQLEADRRKAAAAAQQKKEGGLPPAAVEQKLALAGIEVME